MDNKRIIICGSSSYLEDRIRLFKLKKVLDSAKLNYEYWGWKRPHSKDINITYRIKYLCEGGKGKLVPFFYLWWIFKLFWKVLFIKNSKAYVFYCVGFEAAYPLYIASKFKQLSFVFDNPDNIYLSHKMPQLLKEFLRREEYKIAKNSFRHIIPSKSRWPHQLGNEYFLPNTPLKEDLKEAREMNFKPFEKKHDSQLVIYISGRLVDVRGLQLIRESIKNIDPAKVHWIIAGYIDDVMGLFIKQYSNVTYLGRISSSESLALYYQSDLLFAFYDPVLPINRVAESNKWWDCVATGVPFVSNNGIENLKVFTEAEACFVIDYNNTESLQELLDNLYHHRGELLIKKQNLSKLKPTTWESISEIFERRPEVLV